MQTSANGDIYYGFWLNDRRDGDGAMKFANGSNYKGGWKNGMAEGTGTYTSSDGKEATGSWKNGCFRIGDRVAVAVGTAPETCR
jgi:hypothetical protein